MPSKDITTAGATPILDQSAGRRGVLLTNDSGYPIYWRQGGAVSATHGSQRGHILRPNGGTVMLTDFAAKAAVYACVPTGQPTVQLTYEEYN